MELIQPGPSCPEPSLSPPQYLTRQCPLCGEYLYLDSLLYRDQWGRLVGCDYCLHSVTAEDLFSKGS